MCRCSRRYSRRRRYLLRDRGLRRGRGRGRRRVRRRCRCRERVLPATVVFHVRPMQHRLSVRLRRLPLPRDDMFLKCVFFYYYLLCLFIYLLFFFVASGRPVVVGRSALSTGYVTRPMQTRTRLGATVYTVDRASRLWVPPPPSSPSPSPTPQNAAVVRTARCPAAAAAAAAHPLGARQLAAFSPPIDGVFPGRRARVRAVRPRSAPTPAPTTPLVCVFIYIYLCIQRNLRIYCNTTYRPYTGCFSRG